MSCFFFEINDLLPAAELVPNCAGAVGRSHDVDANLREDTVEGADDR